MSTKLAFLLDECMDGPLADRIKGCSGVMRVEVLNAQHALGNKSTQDPNVIQYAREKELIVVTVEHRMDEKKYTICTHPGIVVLRTRRRHPDALYEAFRKFMLSGHRKRCDHAVVKVHETGCDILFRKDKSAFEPVTTDSVQF